MTAAYWRALRSKVVFTPVGDTAFTAMPRPPSSIAADFTSPITPHLEALYWGEMGAPMRPSTEAMATMRPRRRADIAGMAARKVLAVPVRFTSSTSRHTAGSLAAIGICEIAGLDMADEFLTTLAHSLMAGMISSTICLVIENITFRLSKAEIESERRRGERNRSISRP